jgi:hypothetical protein
VNVAFPGSALNTWVEGEGRTGDVYHYYRYFISNSAPTVSFTSTTWSGSRGVNYLFMASASDANGDSVDAYQWYVDGVYLSSTSYYMYYTFPSSAAAGNHLVYVRAKDALGAWGPWISKAFYIPTAATGITVNVPNGGQTWYKGFSYDVTWSRSGSTGSYVNIYLYKGSSYYATLDSGTLNDGFEIVDIPASAATGSDYRIRVYGTSSPYYSDYSDNYFSIVPGPTIPYITVDYPNGGETWYKGSSYDVRWHSYGGFTGTYVDIYLFKGASWYRTLDSNVLNDGFESVTIPADVATGSDYRIRVWDRVSPYYNDFSDGYFSIVPSTTTCTLTVTNPSSVSTWAPGSAYTITWVTSGDCGPNVKIELLQAGAVIGTMSSSTPNDGSFSWAIWSGRAPGTYQVRVSSTSKPCSDTSDYFTIGTGGTTATITVTSPNGGESWAHGTTHPVTWTYTGSPGANVKIELLKAGASVGTAVASTPNDGSFSWTISSTRPAGTDYKIRVSSTTTSASDTSNNNFIIT